MSTAARDAAAVSSSPRRDEVAPRDRGLIPAYVYVLVLGIMWQFTSGHASEYVKVNIPPDRILIPLGLLMWFFHADRRRFRIRVVPLHLCLLAATGWGVITMINSGSIASREAIFAFADSFGVIPFVLACTAPMIFCTPKRRDVLLWGLAILGLYIGLVACLEGLKLHSLIWPQYINDPSHEHFGRGLGPSQQVGQSGLTVLLIAAFSAALAMRTSGRMRWIPLLSLAMNGAGVLFSLTRSIWIGGLVGAAIAMLMDRRSRRWVLLAAAATPVVIAGVLAAFPSIAESVQERMDDSASGYDRVNVFSAGLRALQAHPITGVGFHNFPNVEIDWLWQLDTIPITLSDIYIHNVLLGYAVDLGIPGMLVWLSALLILVVSAVRRRRPAEDLQPWRLGIVTYGVCWTIVGMLVPITYPLPTSILWLGLALVADPADLGISPRDEPETRPATATATTG